MNQYSGQITRVFVGNCRYLGQTIPMFCHYLSDGYPLSVECNHSKCRWTATCDLYREHAYRPLEFCDE